MRPLPQRIACGPACRRTLLAAFATALASNVAYGHADVSRSGSRPSIAIAGATIVQRGDESALPDAAWGEAFRITGYVHAHRASAHAVVALPPLAPYAASNARVETEAGKSVGRPVKRAAVRRTAALAGPGIAPMR
ncbi:MAG: hypothetical protein ACM3SS_07100 [Rhodospirillaceae bacterium]